MIRFLLRQQGDTAAAVFGVVSTSAAVVYDQVSECFWQPRQALRTA